MRVWMILLLLITTSAALGLGIWYMGNRNQIEIDPAIELPEPDEFVQVYYGTAGELEILLRPYYGDTVEDQFHDEQLNRMIEPTDDRSYGRVWLVNHGKTALPFDARLESEILLVKEGGESARAMSLRSLTDAKGGLEKLDSSTAMILRALGSFDRQNLDSNEFVDLTIALPFRLGSCPLNDVIATNHKVSLKVAKARREDLRAYVSGPEGKMSELLIRSADQETEQEQASRK
ncbi:MAG: hypothetical protein ACI97A_001722 [Planctomycetota bacterium]|jgi:hypothetical protein